MVKIIFTCPKCGTDLIDTVLSTYPPKDQKWCPSCGWTYTYTEDHEEVVRVSFGGNHGNNAVIERSNIPSLNLDYNAFGSLSCLICPSNPANGGDGICFCTLGGPKITW